MKKNRNHHPRVILLEDRMEDSKLFKIVMSEISPKVELICFTSGLELIEYLSKPSASFYKPQIIFMDINLSGHNGLEYLEQIKKHPTWKEIPVIVLTSSAAPADIRQAYFSYANSYIQKPLEVEDFRRYLKIIGDYWLRIVTFSADNGY